MQVVGADEVATLACGVSSSRELFERAAERARSSSSSTTGCSGATRPLVVDRRLRGRLEALFRGDLSLAAYHLALDAHPELGNNALLARDSAAWRGRLRRRRLGGTLGGAGVEELVARLREVRPRAARVRVRTGRMERVAIVSGGGGARLIEAAHEGYDHS